MSIYDPTHTLNLGTGTVSGVATVTVADATAVVGPDVWKNQMRAWNWNGLPASAVVEPGQYLRLLANGGTTTNRAYRLTSVNEDEYGAIVARLGTGGPILRHTLPAVFNLLSTVQGYVRVVEVFPDGTTTIENTLYLSRVPEDIEILLTINTGGAIFATGTLSYSLSRNDFNELGVMSYRVLRPPGKTTSCHWIRALQNGTPLGGDL